MGSPQEYKKRWRHNNQDKRYAQKKRYEDKVLREIGPTKRENWTEDELRQIFAENRPCDREIGKIIRRSPAAIYNQRSKYIKRGLAHLYTERSHAA